MLRFSARLAVGHRPVGLAAALSACLSVSCTDASGPSVVTCESSKTFVPRVGDVLEPDGLVGSGVCVEAEDGGEFLIVVAITSPTAGARRVDILGTDFGPGDERVLERPSPSPGSVARLRPERPSAAIAVDLRLRLAESKELRSRIGSRRTGDGSMGAAGPLAGPLPRGGSPPVPGAIVEYDTSVSCDTGSDVRGGRVVAVTERAVVVVDTLAGSTGFGEDQLTSFGEFFDESVHPTLTTAFGQPSDVDGNGRVVLFFTPASNARRPAGTVGFVGGYFWAGDLFPADEHSAAGGLAPCANSSEAEILYLSVPNSTTSAEDLFTRATIGHEFQHLINASRRLHVNAATEFESTWLNEGLSYLAEEMLFARESGLPSLQNLDGSALIAADAVTAFNEFQFNNVGRYNVYLLAPHFHSAMGSDGVETRGAAWSFLRYALDRLGAPESASLWAWANSTETGIETLRHGGLDDPVGWMAEWSVSLAVDDLVPQAEERYRQPSWNLPSLIRDIRGDGRYPLDLIPVDSETGLRFTLRAGGAGYGSMRVAPGQSARISVRPVEASTGVRAFLVRLR